MKRIHRWALAIACAMFMGAVLAPVPALAMQILEAVDHAELAAEVSAKEVNRIALIGDRIARAVRAPDGFAVEHDAASGDLYLRSAVAGSPETGTGQAVRYDPVTLFLGTERGFTYRLTLTPSNRDAAQILIRNADALPSDAAAAASPLAGTPRVAALVRLVRAVARRQPLPGYEILAGLAPRLDGRGRFSPIGAGSSFVAGLTVIETWRGPRFRALVLEADRLPSASVDGPADLAGTIGDSLAAGRLAALWLAAPGSGPKGGRLAVAVVETARMESPR